MANTPPPPPVSERPTEQLLDELCVELRNVGVKDWSLPDDERVLAHIKQVSSIHRELIGRQISLTARLSELSSQTNWKMMLLLEDCLAFQRRCLTFESRTESERLCVVSVASVLNDIPMRNCFGFVTNVFLRRSSPCKHANQLTASFCSELTILNAGVNTLIQKPFWLVTSTLNN
jgi:hypothetical protein